MMRRVFPFVSLSVILGCLLAFAPSQACLTAQAHRSPPTALTPVANEWPTFFEKTYNLSFRYPPDWSVLPGYL